MAQGARPSYRLIGKGNGSTPCPSPSGGGVPYTDAKRAKAQRGNTQRRDDRRERKGFDLLLAINRLPAPT